MHSALLGLGIATISLFSILSVGAQVSLSSPNLDFELELRPYHLAGLAEKGWFETKETLSGTSNDTDICPVDVKVCQIVINKGKLVPNSNGKYAFSGRIKAFTTDGKDDHNNNVASKFYYFRSPLALSSESETPENITKFFKGDLRSRETDVEFEVSNATLVIDKEKENQFLSVHAQRNLVN
jgi:hypothetical protein